MSYIEDEYKKRFQYQELKTDDVNEEELWKDISNAMATTSPSKYPKQIRSAVYILFGILLTIGLYCKFTATTDTKSTDIETIVNNNDSSDLNNNKLEDQINKQNNKPSNNITTLLKEKQVESEYESIAPISNRLNNEMITKQSDDSKIKKPSLKSQERILKNLESTIRIDKSSANNIKQATNSQLKDSQTESQNDLESLNNSSLSKSGVNDNIKTQIFESNNKTQKLKSIEESKPLLAFLPISPIKLSTIESKLDIDIIDKNLFNPKSNLFNSNNEKSFKLRLGVFSGANLSNFKFSSSTNQIIEIKKNNAEKKQFGFSAGVNASLLSNNKWIFGTGIEYHQLVSKFEYTESKNTSSFIENHLNRVWIDATSNDTIATEYVDTTFNLIETRDVIHYNQFKQFRIPLEFGLQHQFNKWLLGITAGGILNFTIDQSGKGLNHNEEIFEFEKNSTSAPFGKIDMGYRISTLVGYEIFTDCTIMAKPQFTSISKSDIGLGDIAMKSNLFSLNIGLEYQF